MLNYQRVHLLLVDCDKDVPIVDLNNPREIVGKCGIISCSNCEVLPWRNGGRRKMMDKGSFVKSGSAMAAQNCQATPCKEYLY